MLRFDWLQLLSFNLSLPIRLTTDLLTQIHESVATLRRKSLLGGKQITSILILFSLWELMPGTRWKTRSSHLIKKGTVFSKLN